MRIYVGGLPRTATQEEVVRLFKQFGAGDDDVVLPRDRRTRRKKGFAYVTLPDAARAHQAIAIFNGFEIDGKPLTVTLADERPPKKRRPPRSFVIIAFLAASLTLANALPARAGSTTDVTVTLNPLIGTHESFNDTTHPPPVPVPLLGIRHRTGPFEIEISGLPDVASVHSSDAIQGRTSTRLSIFDGTVRVWDPLDRFSVGIGETIYNQGTHYLDGVEIAGVGETQFSRVVGANYELGYHVPIGAGRIEARFTYTPVMLGTQYTIYDVPTYFRRADPERADQVDTEVRYVRRVGQRSSVIFGLRYVNYTARYDEPNGGLSDRNVGLLPSFGYRFTLGK
jgi:hypothetical protein